MKEILKSYGKTNQKIVAMEEMGELIQAISKDLRGQKHNIEEEIADVKIMIKQLELIYDKDLVDSFYEYKLKRIKDVIKNP